MAQLYRVMRNLFRAGPMPSLVAIWLRGADLVFRAELYLFTSELLHLEDSGMVLCISASRGSMSVYDQGSRFMISTLSRIGLSRKDLLPNRFVLLPARDLYNCIVELRVCWYEMQSVTSTICSMSAGSAFFRGLLKFSRVWCAVHQGEGLL